MASESELYQMALVTMYVTCPLTILSLQFLTAPYGKHSRPGWGPTISPPLAWFLMESPTLWLTAILYPFGRHRFHLLSLTLISPFLIHYFHRTILFPLRLLSLQTRAGVKPNGFPFSVALMAFGFNLLNAYIQTRSVTHYHENSSDQNLSFLLVLRLLVGAGVFGWGMRVNITSDLALLRLKEEASNKKKKKNDDGGGGSSGYYKIPTGGWFELVTCPNYMGEATEWLGWTIMCWSPAALAFFLYTCSNLVPRAVANRNWYIEKFGVNFPKARKAILPFVY